MKSLLGVGFIVALRKGSAWGKRGHVKVHFGLVKHQCLFSAKYSVLIDIPIM